MRDEIKFYTPRWITSAGDYAASKFSTTDRAMAVEELKRRTAADAQDKCQWLSVTIKYDEEVSG